MRNLCLNVLSASDSATTNGTQIDANQLVSTSFAAYFGDATAGGTFKLQVSNDLIPYGYLAADFTVTNWADLPNQSATITSGGSALLTVPNMTYRWIRPVYTNTAGGVQNIHTVGDDSARVQISTAQTVADATVTGQPEITQVVTVADTAGSLNNKYFLISAALNTPNYYFWYNVSGGGTDPAIGGKTGVQVAISTNNTAAQVATATNTAFNAIPSKFSSAISGSPGFPNADSIAFDGSTGKMTITTPAALNFERTDSFSFSFWVNCDAGTFGAVKGLLQKYDTHGYFIQLEGNNLRFVLLNDFGGNFIRVTSNADVPLGWQHLAITYDGSSTGAGIAMYLNGALWPSTIGQDALNATIQSTADVLWGTAFGDFFKGNLDEMAIWNIKLSGTQVTEIYNGGFVGNLNATSMSTNLISWWRADNDVAPNILDIATVGHNYTGVLATGATIDAVVFPPGTPSTMNTLTITNASNGIATDATDGAAPTGFAISTTQQGISNVPSNLNNHYFLLSSAHNATNYYVWYNVASGGTDPALAGKTGIQVAIAAGASANAVASATVSPIAAANSGNDFTVGVSTNTVTITDKVTGPATNIADGAVPTGFTFATPQTGLDAGAHLLNNKYFYINAGNNGTAYYVWYNVSGGGTDPMVPAKTGVEVDITADMNATQVATATASALDALAAFISTSTGDNITVTNATGGPYTPATDGAAPTGFTFSIVGGGTSTVNVNMNALSL